MAKSCDCGARRKRFVSSSNAFFSSSVMVKVGGSGVETIVIMSAGYTLLLNDFCCAAKVCLVVMEYRE